MEFFHHYKTLLLSELLTICLIVMVLSLGTIYTPPDVERLTDRFSRLPINQGYDTFFGGSNVRLTNNGSSTDLILDKSSGSGLISRDKYYNGFFNAILKLPANFTSGVVVAFYLSNQNSFPHNHDELDFELLGYEKRRRNWVLQTNFYGNGSVSTGREEKLYFWFDPTQDFHDYILWNNHHIVFLVDNVPIREVVHNAAISSVYPSKPMSIYATIWDGSEWATHGGKYPVNYTYAPFVTSLKGVDLEGCVSQQNATSCAKRSTSSLDPMEGEEFVKLSQKQMTGLDWARRKHMFYSYCQDTKRYKVLPPECTAN